MAHSTVAGHGGLETIVFADPSGTAEVQVYLHGGQVNSWKVRGEEQLFMSTAAVYDGAKPMRGGIPVVFPQFGLNGPLPQHGFARTSPWRFVGVSVQGNAAVGTFELVDTAATRALWDHAFRLVLCVRLEAQTLSVRLDVENTGSAPFTFAALLHSYFAVGSIHETTVSGFRGLTYVDKMRNSDKFVEDRELADFTRETDRIYEEVGRLAVEIRDGAKRRVRVAMEGFRDCVLFNPWIEKSRNLVDMNDDGYLNMVAVEPGTVSELATLQPGGCWSGTETVELLS